MSLTFHLRVNKMLLLSRLLPKERERERERNENIRIKYFTNKYVVHTGRYKYVEDINMSPCELTNSGS